MATVTAVPAEDLATVTRELEVKTKEVARLEERLADAQQQAQKLAADVAECEVDLA